MLEDFKSYASCIKIEELDRGAKLDRNPLLRLSPCCGDWSTDLVRQRRGSHEYSVRRCSEGGDLKTLSINTSQRRKQIKEE